MARSDWAYVNLDKGLMDEVDKIAETVFLHGTRKYSDRKDFVTIAVQKLLEKEKKSVEVVAK
jgi:metal-responsive CopG/Arc/MetJ family transcriptional regulator